LSMTMLLIGGGFTREHHGPIDQERRRVECPFAASACGSHVAKMLELAPIMPGPEKRAKNCAAQNRQE
ncbi:MAG: hypothetical protein WBC94_09805, partial [Xanthobacteraceae bacterium]